MIAGQKTAAAPFLRPDGRISAPGAYSGRLTGNKWATANASERGIRP